MLGHLLLFASDVVKRSFFLFQVQEMTTLIRKAFISNLDSADWMDTETKEAAKEKVWFKVAQKIFP